MVATSMNSFPIIDFGKTNCDTCIVPARATARRTDRDDSSAHPTALAKSITVRREIQANNGFVVGANFVSYADRAVRTALFDNDFDEHIPHYTKARKQQRLLSLPRKSDTHAPATAKRLCRCRLQRTSIEQTINTSTQKSAKLRTKPALCRRIQDRTKSLLH
jgi:hypothetical protein